MIDFEQTAAEARNLIAEASQAAELERLRIHYLGARGVLAPPDFTQLATGERQAAGRAYNLAKRSLQEALAQRLDELRRRQLAGLANMERIDVTLPGQPPQLGRLHVLTVVQREIETVMERMGYQVEIGPEVETDWYNFEALNLPRGHASRDMQETFFLNESETLVLRTHTSPMQIRTMLKYGEPPIYAAMPGRVYRQEATDASHLAQFMQVEALAVDVGITVGDLKGTVQYFSQSLWDEERRVRFRPSYFPYTEPSFEFDVSCMVCGGRGCRSCGGDGWLEAGGCGMVHPAVLRNGNIDPEHYSGFAWGFGIERIAMLKYGVEDLRLFYENDHRFLEQF
ncbi:MAG: phenylalanine--tRNA ligase subunit alpha [Candidatus Dormibacteraeota bacterium]|uniref:Phenylalanine--tRNA ligase alpha subunit n=1 Tax=Candidatus Dormiibacter inghamiae TaxID=3127013 RepID=A0A934NCK5_9BACT|nr:phenylalanine--tRNA ligase subunit alpha [Candidatus Dormibacteraeota bacterium]MBJ7607457.1 phenylalanine--tRNA ligase subunit alpha [Candidatus Dormibacteraeota bacterium]